MKRVLLYARHVQPDYLTSLGLLSESFRKYEWKAAASENLAQFITEHDLDFPVTIIKDHQQLKDWGPDMALTLGGDGTILGVTCLIRELETPIIGVNLGRLGFLAAVEKKIIDKSLEKVAEGQYQVESRSMLTLDSDPDIFGDLNFALNDFAVHKRDTSSMISIHTYIDGDYLNSYWADGLIIATPTGSTGYSLSCGGPIVFPGSGNMAMTAVAPHNLNVRSLVLSDESVITIEVEGRTKNFLATLDSRYQKVTAAHKLVLRKCHFSTKLIRLDDQSFRETIQEKLSWGKDKRN